MKRRRVKITGIGPVTPAGIGREAFWKGILEPVSRVREVRHLEKYGVGALLAADVRDFDVNQYVKLASSKRLARHTQFALAAASLAVADAGLSFDEIRRQSPVVVSGATLMDFGVIMRLMEGTAKRGWEATVPASLPAVTVSAISAAITDQIGGAVRAVALQSDCCSGVDAIGHAANMVATGEAEMAICGGTEAPLFLHPLLDFVRAELAPAGTASPDKISRPFDRWRTTGVLGEGACMVLLEPEESTRAGYAFVEGYAYATDPKGVPVDGLRPAIRLALANAAIRPSQIESIYAWGPGHKIIDAAEARVLHDIFPSIESIPTASIKGSIGNPLGAAGAIQVGCAALGMHEGVMPPTVNWEYNDAACALNLSGKPRYIEHGTAIINAHGISGSNACLVMTQ